MFLQPMNSWIRPFLINMKFMSLGRDNCFTKELEVSACEGLHVFIDFVVSIADSRLKLTKH